MSKVVVGWFEDETTPRVYEALREAGFHENEIAVRSNGDGTSREELNALGIPEGEAKRYAEQVAEAGSVVTVTARDEAAPEAVEILERYGAREYRERIEQMPSIAAKRRQTNGGDGGGLFREERLVIPIVEERLELGKREVETGTVRVRSRIVEEEFEDEVVLREEHVRVERRKVKRPARENDLEHVGRERRYDLIEHAEEPVVSRTARVVEEVIIEKDIDTRVEQIHETVHHNEVEVENAGVSTADTDEERYFRSQTPSLFGSGARWEAYRPAFAFGRVLREDPRWGGRPWDEVKVEARDMWENDNPGTWSSVERAVRTAFEYSAPRLRKSA